MSPTTAQDESVTVSQWAGVQELRAVMHSLSENGCKWEQLRCNPLLWQATLSWLGADLSACAWLWSLANLNSRGWAQASCVLLRAVAKARELKEQKTIGEDAARAISKLLTAECKHGMLFHGVTAAHPL